ncbi:MAG: hypothetical protein ACYTGN_04930 [Planctomycetota bacterium]
MNNEETMQCVNHSLNTEPTLGRFVYYKALTAIPLFAALVALFRHAGSLAWPLAYVGLCLLHAVVMLRFKCTHCAYYRLGGALHHCFIWWGMPKIFKVRPGPEKPGVGVYAPIGMLVLTFFPVYWLAAEWELLVLYLLSIGVLLTTIGQNECPRCLNFDCPHNQVPEDVRSAYQGGPAPREPAEVS